MSCGSHLPFKQWEELTALLPKNKIDAAGGIIGTIITASVFLLIAAMPFMR